MKIASEIAAGKSLLFDGTDLEIRAQLHNKTVTIDVVKAGRCVHRVVIDDAVGPLEHEWIADLFAREDRVHLGHLTREAAEYLESLNTNQG